MGNPLLTSSCPSSVCATAMHPAVAKSQNLSKPLQKYDCAMEKKMTTLADFLCCGFPTEFGILHRALCFDDKPDYFYLQKLFRDVFAREV
jgi:hypothetical protein